jgi:hypothetical protein
VAAVIADNIVSRSSDLSTRAAQARIAEYFAGVGIDPTNDV